MKTEKCVRRSLALKNKTSAIKLREKCMYRVHSAENVKSTLTTLTYPSATCTRLSVTQKLQSSTPTPCFSLLISNAKPKISFSESAKQKVMTCRDNNGNKSTRNWVACKRKEKTRVVINIFLKRWKPVGDEEREREKIKRFMTKFLFGSNLMYIMMRSWVKRFLFSVAIVGINVNRIT